MGGEGGDMVFRQVCMVLYFGGGVMEGWMDITASWVITRFAEMPAGRLGRVMLEVDGVGLFGWLVESSW